MKKIWQYKELEEKLKEEKNFLQNNFGKNRKKRRKKNKKFSKKAERIIALMKTIKCHKCRNLKNCLNTADKIIKYKDRLLELTQMKRIH